MAFLAERMAAMVLETAMPDLTADGIADALILDGKVVAPATDAAVSSTQCCRRRRCGKEQNKQTRQAGSQKNSVGGQTQTCFLLLFWSLASLTRLAWGLGGGYMYSLNGLYSSMHCVGMFN